jgi:uncharacterized protein (DUF983 family)
MRRSTVILRGVRGRCPRCGGRGIFRSMNELKDRCPTCNLGFVREEGYWLGAMVMIMALVLVFFGVFFVGGMLLTWPDVPWTFLLIGSLVLNGLVPFLLYGWSKALWLGLDHAFNPASVAEEADAIAAAEAPDGVE